MTEDTLRDQVADQLAAAIDGCGIPLVYRRQVKATVLLALAAVPALSVPGGLAGTSGDVALRKAVSVAVRRLDSYCWDCEGTGVTASGVYDLTQKCVGSIHAETDSLRAALALAEQGEQG